MWRGYCYPRLFILLMPKIGSGFHQTPAARACGASYFLAAKSLFVASRTAFFRALKAWPSFWA